MLKVDHPHFPAVPPHFITAVFRCRLQPPRSPLNALPVGEALEFAMVSFNTGSISLEVAPFGGMKPSGAGREGSHHGIEESLETKAFHFGSLSDK